MRSILALVVALVAASAPAAAQKASEAWTRQGDRLVSAATGISVPAQVNGLAINGDPTEFSHAGENVDTGVRYQSADGKFFATVYLYLPAMAEAGMASISTKKAIEISSEDKHPVAQGSWSEAVGGTAGRAIGFSYTNYRGEFATRTAIAKVGRWLLKFRVTGPEASEQAVVAIMRGFLDGTRIPAALAPVATAPATNPACATITAAAQLKPVGKDQTQRDAQFAAADAGASIGGPGRIDGSWCRTSIAFGKDNQAPLVRRMGTPPSDGRAHSVALVLYGDNGDSIEVFRTPDGRFVLLNHGIAQTDVFGSFDRELGDMQLSGLVTGEFESGTRRAHITLPATAQPKPQVSIDEAP